MSFALVSCGTLPDTRTYLPLDADVRSYVRIGNYQISPDNTVISFIAGPTTIGPVKGQFTDFSGELVITDPVEGKASLAAVLKVHSLDAGGGYIEKTLLGSDWFSVDDWDIASFTGGLKSWNEDQTGNLSGEMTIRGVSREQDFNLVLTCEDVENCPEKWVGFVARAYLDRTNYGMTSMQGLVGSEVQLTVEGTLKMESQ